MLRLFVLAVGLILSFTCSTPSEAKNEHVKETKLSTIELGDEQVFSFEGISCTFQAPANFLLTENLNQTGKMFIFSDSSKDKNERCTLSLSIVPTGSPRFEEFLNGVLDPYRKGLQDYKEKKARAEKINGLKFENRIFSGKFPNGTSTVGFAYITATRGSYFVFVGNANGSESASGLRDLLTSVRTFK